MRFSAMLFIVLLYFIPLLAQDSLVMEKNYTVFGQTGIEQEDIITLPGRDLRDLINWMPGVISQDDQLHFWGGRIDEVAFQLNGYFGNDPVSRKLGVVLIPEAIDRVEVNPGWVPIGSTEGSSGLVSINLKKGAEKPEFSLSFQTDQYGKRGTEFAGTTVFGDKIMTATYSGPLYFKSLRLFAALEKNGVGDTRKAFSEGFNFNDIPYTDINFAGDTLRNWSYADGITPRNHASHWNWNSRLTFEKGGYDFDATTFFREGNFYQDRNPALSVINPREQYVYENQRQINLSLAKQITENMRVKVGYQNYHNYSETKDSYLGDDWKSWYDSTALAKVSDIVLDPGNVSAHNIAFFPVRAPGYSPDYKKTETNSNSVFAEVTHKWNGNLLKAGVIQRSSKYYQYEISPRAIRRAELLGGYENMATLDWLPYTGRISGYSFSGDKEKPIEEPFNPSYRKIFISNDWKSAEIKFQAGIAVESFDINSWKFNEKLNTNPPDPILQLQYSRNAMEEQTFNYVSPRISMTSSGINGIQYNISVGRFISEPDMRNLFPSYYYDAYSSRGSTPQIGYDIRPAITDLIQLGVSKKFGKTKHITGIFYYKKSKNLLTLDTLSVRDLPYFIETSKGKNNIYGFNLSAEYGYKTGVTLKGNYNYVHTSGTIDGDYPGKNILYGGLTYSTADVSSSFEQKHRINLLVEYKSPVDNKNKLLKNTKLTGVLRINSGHPYTPFNYSGFGDPAYYGVRPWIYSMTSGMGAPNSETTPWQTYFDLYGSKRFELPGGTHLTWFVRIQNLFNFKNSINVFPFTGKANKDGFFESDTWNTAQTQEINHLKDLYQAINLSNGLAYYEILNKELYNHPRQIIMGIKFEI